MAPLRGDDAPLTTSVKAIYLYKFAPFVEWPKGAFASLDSPFRICVVGDDVLASLAARAAAGETVGDREVLVDELSELRPDENCQELFVGGDRGTVRDALTAARGRPVLTFTDQQGFGTNAIVRFVIRDGRVRFEIDARQADAAGLRISPKVLELATSVIR